MTLPLMLCERERGERGLVAEGGGVPGIHEAENLACGVLAVSQPRIKGGGLGRHGERLPLQLL